MDGVVIEMSSLSVRKRGLCLFPHKRDSASVQNVRTRGREGQHQYSYLLQPLCPKELWHFVHQCYGNELGLTSDDEDYVPPDDDFNTMG